MTAQRIGQRGFSAVDWFILALLALFGGSTFYLIKLSLHDFSPQTISWVRITLGALVLAILPAARAPLTHRRDWWQVIALALIWVAIPFYLAPLAQTTIDSALAGMVNAAVPLFTAAFAVLLFRATLSRLLIAGLAVGFFGVVVISFPSFGGPQPYFGILLAILTTAMYGFSFNLMGSLQQRNSTLSIIWRTLLVAAIVSTPTGILGITWHVPAPSSVVALVLLGCLSTGGSFALLAWLIKRVGPTRASISVYLMPIISIVLGVTLAGERISSVAILGIALVLVGAFIASRGLSGTRPVAL